MKSIPFITILFASIVLTACGGGGSGDSTSPPVENKTFTLSLDSVDITRTSNGETIAVDTANVSTDTLTYRP